MKNRHLNRIFIGLILLLVIPAINIVFLVLSPRIYTILYIIPAASILVLIALYERAELKLSYIAACVIFPVASPVLVLFLLCLTRGSRKGRRGTPALKKPSRELIRMANGAIATALSLDPDASLVYDFKADYYTTGQRMAEDIFRDIALAEELICLEYYIVSEGEFLDRLLAALCEAVSRGVRVCFIYDDLGSVLGVPPDFSLRLAKMGILAVPFSPISSSAWRTNCRDHKKLLIIDGRVVYTGGINISDEYIGAGSYLGKWKDSGIRIESDTVMSVADGFEKMLASACADGTIRYQRETPIPKRGRSKRSACVIFSSYPTRLFGSSAARDVISQMICCASERVTLVTPYFIPDASLFDLILRTARRGVIVDIIIPGIPDKRLIRMLAEGFFEELLSAGASIYEYTPGFLHSKIILADGETALVGSVNLDQRSLYQNFECAALIYNSPVIEDVKEDIDGILSECRKINIADGTPSAIKRAVHHVFRAALPIL